MQARTETFASKEGYLITTADEPTAQDIRWAKYLYSHLQKRANSEDVVDYGVSDKDMWHVIIKMDPEAENSFSIERQGREVKLTASGNKEMIWLQYQLIKKISKEDPRIDASDLPPAIINITDTCGNFAFDYQGIYSPSGLNEDFSGVVGLDNFENSWGIWGHNLRKVIKSNIESTYATINGEKSDSQFCFSSEELYKQIVSYIIDNFGEKDQSRFVIAPNDTPLACTCELCKAAGNTTNNSSPAVAKLITRLAKRFPNHQFFTLSYLSTRKAPQTKLPSNTGVIISSIDFPLQALSSQTKPNNPFITQLEQWKKVTKNIYVWDYINNFDDYLTPFPIVKLAQQRLQLYKSLGINGVFYNGSGYNYASFDGMKTFVLSALLINPELSVEELIRLYLNQEYPTSKTSLYNYYLSLENRALQDNQLSLYGGIQDAESTFLKPEEFNQFYDEMDHLLMQAKGLEKKKLHRLRTALSFTRLELSRSHSADVSKSEEWVEKLKEHEAFPEMKYYNESEETISGYIAEWQQYISESDLSNNLLSGVHPSITPPWENSTKGYSVLTDGIHGLPSSYHFGWLIIPKSKCTISLPVKKVEALGTGTLQLSFLSLPRHRIFVPQKVELYKDGVFYQSIEPKQDQSSEKGQMIKTKTTINLNGTALLEIKLIGIEKDRAQMALDEIAFLR